MNMKTFLLLPVMAFPLLACAQDKIYETNGAIIAAKVKKVSERDVTYLKQENLNGPEYKIARTDVDKIVYENGSTDEFDAVRPSRRHRMSRLSDSDKAKMQERPDVLAVALLQFSENGVGFGLSYERALDKNGLLAFYMPVFMTINLNNNTYQDATGNYVNGPADKMYYAMPGIKIYPTGCYGMVRYSIGPSLAIASGEKSDQVYVTTGGSYNGYYYSETRTHTMLGMVINNTLNMNPTPHIYLSLELGIGFTYLNRLDGLNQGTQGMVQGGFKLGYRF